MSKSTTLPDVMDKILGAYGSYLTTYNDHKGRFDPLDLEQATQQILTSVDQAVAKGRIEELERLQKVKFNEKALDNNAIYMYAFDRIAALNSNKGARE